MTTTRQQDLAGSVGEPCPLTAALGVIGGRWSLIVLYWLCSGTRRFNELRRLMPAISAKVMAGTLRDLERAGLLERTVYPEVPPRVEYALSAHGRSVEPVVEAVRVWGHRQLDHAASGAERAR